MEEVVFCRIRDDVLAAEEQYTSATKEARGINAAAKAIERMRRIHASKIERGEDATGIENLLSASEEKLRKALISLENEVSSPNQAVLDFVELAHNLQSAVRPHESMVLSLDSSSNGSDQDDSDDESSSEQLDTTKSVASKLLWQITPLAKHKEETFHFLQTTNDKQLNKVTICAWSFAVICMLTTLAFLTKDFIHSQLNPGIRVEQVTTKELSVPAITVCNPTEGLPSFLNYPTEEYPGHPLFGIASVRNTHGSVSENPFIDASGKSDFIDPAFKGSNATKCESDLSKMSISRARQALYRFEVEKNSSLIDIPKLDSNPCFQCFTVGGRREQKLSQEKFRSPVDMPISLNIMSSRIMSFCQIRGSFNTVLFKDFFNLELTTHFDSLIAAGILSVPDGLSESEKKGLFLERRTFNGKSYRSFLCSVYFFAGYFYPSEDAGSVKYDWSKGEEKWKPAVGSRTYSVGTVEEGKYNYTFGPGKTSHQDVHFSRGIELFFEDPKKTNLRKGLLAPDCPLTFIDGPSTSNVYFTRRDEGDRGIIYDTKVTTSTLVSMISRYDHWRIGFDYTGFTTTKRSTQPSMSWPEFMTDIFEYIGLFTGVCIFSMIVAPSQALV